MALSLQRAVSNGSLTSLALSIDYFDRNDITVTIGGVVKPLGTGWSWVGTTGNTISFSPAVANGLEVTIKRSTQLAAPRHEYTKGAQFVSETLDENFRQTLYAVQEAKEGSVLSEVFNDLDVHGFKLLNIGPATNPGDAVSLGQYQADAAGASVAKNTAVQAASDANASKVAAKTSEDNALGSKNAAATSASNASTSEGNALSSKNAAATSAQNAATSETNALGSKNAAANSLSTFQNQYQGPKASAPTLRTDNSALQIGDLYFDTTSGMRVYTATGWASAGSSVNGTAKRGSIVATAGQTVFPIPGGFDSGFIDIYLDGVKLVGGVDVTVNASPNVTLAIGALAGQTLDYVAYGTFSVANTYDQATITAMANTQQYRNRIINGGMVVQQRRNAGTNATGSGQFGSDRWLAAYGASAGNVQICGTIFGAGQSPAPGLSSYLQLYQDQVGANITEFVARQWVEASFVKDLAGKKATLSFWYKSKLTGQHVARIIANYSSATYGQVGAQDIILPFTVNVAEVWEFKTLTFDAFTNITSWGTLPDHMAGAIVDIGFKSGAFGKATLALGDYFQLTGVQLEPGSVATPFEYRPYQLELTMCQRYFQTVYASFRMYSPVTNATMSVHLNWPIMRVSPVPTIVQAGGSVNTYQILLTEYNSFGGRLECVSAGVGDCYTTGRYYGLSAEQTS